MKVFQTERHALHDPQFFLVRGQPRPAAEQPERAHRLLAAARAQGHDIAEAPDRGLAPIAEVHTPEYLDYLQVAHRQWRELPGASAEVIPNAHPGRRPAHYPRSIVGRAGWHSSDTGAPIGAGTWEASYAAAQVAVAAADQVLTVSLHADPHDFYPYFWGHAHERGEDEGEGFNLNLPLPLGSGDGPWLAAGGQALERLSRFAPDALVVALGLDAAESDPLQGLRITRPGFARMAGLIAALGLPTVLVQEGGYLGPELGDNLIAFLDGFERARP